MGGNALGPCMFQALLAYDCTSNPDHRVRLEARDIWDCLQRSGSCADVDACVSEGSGTHVCSGTGDYTRCEADLRIRCSGGGAKRPPKALGSENCALWGKTCATGASETECAGSSGLVCHESDQKECSGTSIHWCSAVDGGSGGPDAAGIDRGIDCASNGASACDGFPSRDAPRWVACRTNPDADGGANACAPSASATCKDGRATSCPSGVRETIDCATLLGAAGAGAACTDGPLVPPFDWTSPCAMGTPECTSDSCDGTMVRSCDRGATFSADCEHEGLGSCRLQTADSTSVARAACAPP